MKNWQEGYKEKITTAAEAVKLVKSGDRITFSHACGEPRTLPAALVKRAAELQNVQIVHQVPMGEALYCKAEHADSFQHVALFAGGPTRAAIWECRGDYIPRFNFEIPSLFDSMWPVDAAMVTVSPPDKNGFCSLGVSVD
jgi:4-hydroxybutyrate CoA-transferase